MNPVDTDAQSSFLSHVPDSAFVVTPVVAGRTELTVTIILGNSPHSFHCCTGREESEGIYFTAPSETNVDYLAVATNNNLYVIDSNGLSDGCETIISPDGAGVWRVEEWITQVED